jgi:hypothetical protein
VAAGQPQTDILGHPQTTVSIEITVEKKDIVAGPYARYSQKYLGVSAPLADKVTHEIIDAKLLSTSQITQTDTPAPAPETQASQPRSTSHTRPAQGFPKLSVDRTSNAPQSLEESARLAAERLFSIRKSRFELITGEAGENVFGAGLAAALAELNRLEEELLALFLGRQTDATITKRMEIAPSEGRLTYIACRFSTADGILPTDDLSGEPIVLEFVPLPATISTAGLETTLKPSKGDPGHRLAAQTECRLFFGATNLAEATFPVFQFGKTVYLAK